MAGRAKLEAFSKKVDRKGGDSHIFDQIADGRTMREIAEPFGVSRGMIYLWIKAGGDERKQRFAAARRESADAHVENAKDILDKVSRKRMPTNPEVAIARERAQYEKWLATVRDREQYGERSKEVAVNVNVGSLHLDALRAHGGAGAVEGSDLDEIEEAEVIMIADAETVEAENVER